MLLALTRYVAARAIRVRRRCSRHIGQKRRSTATTISVADNGRVNSGVMSPPVIGLKTARGGDMELVATGTAEGNIRHDLRYRRNAGAWISNGSPSRKCDEVGQIDAKAGKLRRKDEAVVKLEHGRYCALEQRLMKHVELDGVAVG